jgi:hypothetical protein
MKMTKIEDIENENSILRYMFFFIRLHGFR